MKPNHAITYLRQICCSGLSKEIAITEFLKSIPLLIPSNSNTFSVGNKKLLPDYHLAGFDLSDMATIAPTVIAEYHTPERQRRAMNWFGRYSTIDNPEIMEASFYRTDLYNLVYRHFDMHYVLWIPVPLPDKNVGILGLYRPKTQKPFDKQDQTQLMRLLPYLNHAYRAANDANHDMRPDGLSGMLILDLNGSIVYQSPEASLLLKKARFPRLLIDLRQQDRILAKLAELCGNLQRIFRGLDAPPPSYIHDGPTGQFVFHAFWLDGCGNDTQNLIGMTIEHRQPLVLNILQSLRDSPLSPAQKDVALLLAQGLTLVQISRRLHIKPITVKDHVRKIYDKLDIHRREDLLPKLLPPLQ